MKVVVSVSTDKKEFVEVKECTAGCHQRTNDTVYIREYFEIIEPRGVVSRVKKQWAKLGTLSYTPGKPKE